MYICVCVHITVYTNMCIYVYEKYINTNLLSLFCGFCVYGFRDDHPVLDNQLGGNSALRKATSLSLSQQSSVANSFLPKSKSVTLEIFPLLH